MSLKTTNIIAWRESLGLSRQKISLAESEQQSPRILFVAFSDDIDCQFSPSDTRQAIMFVAFGDGIALTSNPAILAGL